MKNDKLNPRHKAFADEYLANGMNAKQAYLSVYRNVKKSTTAEANGSRLLSNAKVKAYIDEMRDKTAKKHSIDRDWIVNEYMQIIESSKTEGHDGAGNLKDRTSWNKSLAQLAKLLGLDAPEKTEVEHKGITINIEKPKQ